MGRIISANSVIVVFLAIAFFFAGCMSGEKLQSSEKPESPESTKSSSTPSEPTTPAELTTTAESTSDEPTPAVPENLPKPGDPYEYQKTKYVVAGAGNTAFEYTATGESLAILADDQAVAVIVPASGAAVRIDPSIPGVFVDGKEHDQLASNGYFQKNMKDKVFLLLEYDRAEN